MSRPLLISMLIFSFISTVPLNLLAQNSGSSVSCACDPTQPDCSNQCENCGTSVFLPRPQGLDSAALYNPYWYYTDMNERTYWLWADYRFQQTFRDENIARCLFGSQTLFFSGSKADPAPHHIIADYFGFAPNFKGQITFHPRIQNHIVDIVGRVELGHIWEDLENTYVWVNASLVDSRWSLRPEETIFPVPQDEKFSIFPQCAMSEAPSETVPTFFQLTNDKGQIISPGGLSGRSLFGDMKTPWKAGRFVCDTQDEFGLANVDLIIGHDFFRCPDYHLGVFIKAVAPTGNKPDPDRVFSPIVGNGHHWELGAGIDTHLELWESGDQTIDVFVIGSVTHLFKDTQRRTFDFLPSDFNVHNGCLSRYLLLKEFNDDNVYVNNLISAVNFTTRTVKSSFNAQGDAAIRLLYRYCGWAAAAGYNVYGRTREKLENVCCTDQDIIGRNFGIKGTSGTCGIGFENGHVTDARVKLSATESTARINDAIAPVDDAVVLPTYITWDSSHQDNGPEFIRAEDSRNGGKEFPKLLVCENDLDIKGIPAQLTHKFFAHVDYRWDEYEWKPYFGIGGGVEFAQNGDCNVCTPYQWELWLRTGISY